ncbi:MAG TPA: hypothetical protein VN924_18940 [Bryobacteraceae bacterium]|nr:hypothetical protein [Bryobacteraceae bacterium]
MPCIFSIYLHPDDHKRLAGIQDLTKEDASRALAPRLADWNGKLSPIFSRTFRTSTSGTQTGVTRTLSLPPLVHAIASFNPWIMLSPTLTGFRTRVVFRTADFALVFVVISRAPTRLPVP